MGRPYYYWYSFVLRVEKADGQICFLSEETGTEEYSDIVKAISRDEQQMVLNSLFINY